MIDPEFEIRKIGKQAKDIFGDRFYRIVEDHSRDELLNLLDSKLLSKQQRNSIKMLLANMPAGQEQEINEDTEKEIDKFWDVKIAKAIESGKLPKPSRESRALMARMQKRLHG